MDEKDDDRLPSVGQTWEEMVTSTFPPDQAVAVVDPLSPYYLKAGFVDHVDPTIYIVHVKMPGERYLVEFRSSQLRIVR